MNNQNLSHKCFLFAKSNAVAERSLLAILVLSSLLSGCTGTFTEKIALTPSTPVEFAFDQYEIGISSAKYQTILTGFLLNGDFAELVAVNSDGKGNRYLRVYAFDNNKWTLRLDTTLRPDVLFVDVANIGGRDRLIIYEHGRLNWFDPESAKEHTLVAITAMTPPSAGEIPHVDITRDVNGDTRDDLVVPDADGFWVFIQTKNGAFTDPVKLGPPTEVDRIYDPDEYRHTPWNQSRIHEMDYNRDGRSDLVFWNIDDFKVHLQDKQGCFASAATTFTTRVAFDSDDLASLAAPHGVRRRIRDRNPTGDLTGRVLHALTDMNGDGVADLVVFSLLGGSLWHMHSTYEVYFGTPMPDGGTGFSTDVSTAIHLEGIPFGIGQHDFDQDGEVDMMFTTLKLGIFRVIGVLIDGILTGSVSRDLEIYRMKGGIYSDKPDATHEIEVYPRSESGEKAAIFPSLLIGDVNGDKHLDLIIQKGRKELRVFLGVSGPNLFTRKPKKVAVTLPNNEKHTWLVDLNNDDKQDILMYHPSTTESNRVTLLIAR